MFPYYYGPIKQLKKELNKIRPRMRRAYEDILGPLFPLVAEADRNYLNAQSFQELSLLEKSGIEIRSKANKFFIATQTDLPVEFHNDGSFSAESATTVCPGFIFSEEGFELSHQRYQNWISPYLAPYIHEYNHFVIWAIQPKPMALASRLLCDKIKPSKLPLSPADIQSLIDNCTGTFEERAVVAGYAVWSMVINETYEISTRMIDAAIYRRLAFKPTEDYFNIPPKRFVPFPLAIRDGAKIKGLNEAVFSEKTSREELENILQAQGMMLFMVVTGDVFHGTSIPRRLTILREWLKCLTPSSSLQHCFVESLKALQVKKAPLSILIDQL